MPKQGKLDVIANIASVSVLQNPFPQHGRAERLPYFVQHQLPPTPKIQTETLTARGRITQDEYDKKALELKDRQAELAARISQYQSGNEEFRTTLETLISVASRAVELFERSKSEQKRQLIALVFSNLKLRGKKLEYSMRSSFDLMVDRPTYERPET